MITVVLCSFTRCFNQTSRLNIIKHSYIYWIKKMLKKEVANNEDRSSSCAPWQHGPYKHKQLEQHETRKTTHLGQPLYIFLIKNIGRIRIQSPTYGKTYVQVFFRKADNFCQGIEQKVFGRLFPSLLPNPNANPKKPDSKRSKESCLGLLSFFLRKYSSQFTNADRSKYKKWRYFQTCTTFSF